MPINNQNASSAVMHETQMRVEGLEHRWMIGNIANLSLEHFPEEWQPALADQSVERLSLAALAIYSQYQALLFEPEVTAELKAKPNLPELEYPFLPATIRPSFKRVLEAIQQQAGIKIGHLLNLLLQRKYSAHPADWLPSVKDDELPSLYWPWCRWVSNELSASQEATELTEETWDDFYPAERLTRLRDLRHRDPQAARELISACAPKESAEKRIKLIEVLAINLNEQDSEFLQSLTQNRSQKVSLLATQYLARLGIGHGVSEDENAEAMARELAETYELKKSGILKKGLKLLPIKLKSKKQQSVRSELLQKIPVGLFAHALSIDVKELLMYWQFSENRDHDNQSFIANAVNNIADEHVSILLDNIRQHLDSSDAMVSFIRLLLPRLHEHDRASLMLNLMQDKNITFSFLECLAYIDGPLAELKWDMLIKTKAWLNLSKSLREESQEKSYIEEYYLTRELMALGLFLPQSTAQSVLDAVVDIGLLRADPALESLKLNIQLDPIK